LNTPPPAQAAPDAADCNVPCGLRLRGPLCERALSGALALVFARHDALRTRIVVRVGALPLQVVAPPPGGAPARARQVGDAAALPAEPAGSGQGLDTLGLSPALVRGLPAAALRRVLADAHAPFDLDAGPLVRALLLRLGPEDHLFVVTVHHAVADGGSLRARARPAFTDVKSLGPGVPCMMGWWEASSALVSLPVSRTQFGP